MSYLPKGYRPTYDEIARRDDWIRYLLKQGYSQLQVAKRLQSGPTVISQSCTRMKTNVRRYANRDLPMDPIDWLNERPPATSSPRISRDGIIKESLALLEFLEGEEALFRLATLAEEGELSPEQEGRLFRLRDYLADMCKAVRDPRFREQIRQDPLKYRS